MKLGNKKCKDQGQVCGIGLQGYLRSELSPITETSDTRNGSNMESTATMTIANTGKR
jgi:hypothetical protein